MPLLLVAARGVKLTRILLNGDGPDKKKLVQFRPLVVISPTDGISSEVDKLRQSPDKDYLGRLPPLHPGISRSDKTPQPPYPGKG